MNRLNCYDRPHNPSRRANARTAVLQVWASKDGSQYGNERIPALSDMQEQVIGCIPGSRMAASSTMGKERNAVACYISRSVLELPHERPAGAGRAGDSLEGHLTGSVQYGSILPVREKRAACRSASGNESLIQRVLVVCGLPDHFDHGLDPLHEVFSRTVCASRPQQQAHRKVRYCGFRLETAERAAKAAPSVERLPGTCGSEGDTLKATLVLGMARFCPPKAIYLEDL